MPVTVKKVGNKYRIVGPYGGLEKSLRGKAVDGGGHLSKDKAEAQARAINASYEKPKK